MSEGQEEIKSKKYPRKGNYIPPKELIVFSAAAFGQGMIYAAMSSYVSDFYLNVMGLSPMFVLLLMLFARVWDAVNDPIMGLAVEKADTKWGKYKPYVLFTFVPIALLTFFMFYVPRFADQGDPHYNENATYIFVSFIYVFWGMVYTASDIPFWSLPNAMTPNANERGKTISLARMFNGVGSAIPMAIIMLLGFITGKHGEVIPYKTRYLIMAITASVSGGLLFAASFLTTQERVKIPKPVKEANTPSALKVVFTNKQLLLVVFAGLLACGRYMIQVASVHVSRYTFYLDGMSVAQSQSTVQLVLGIASAAGMFLSMIACPFLIRKFHYKQLLLTTCIGGGAAALCGYFVGLFTHYNLWAVLPFLFLSSIPLGMLNVVCYAMIGDCLDQMELKTGRRATGLGMACQTFVNKIDNAFATTFIIAMYMIVGLNVGDIAATGGEFANPIDLPNKVRNGMFMLVTIVPAVSLLLCCIPLFFYDLVGEKREKMLEDLKEARKARGIAIEETTQTTKKTGEETAA